MFKSLSRFGPASSQCSRYVRSSSFSKCMQELKPGGKLDKLSDKYLSPPFSRVFCLVQTPKPPGRRGNLSCWFTNHSLDITASSEIRLESGHKVSSMTVKGFESLQLRPLLALPDSIAPSFLEQEQLPSHTDSKTAQNFASGQTRILRVNPPLKP